MMTPVSGPRPDDDVLVDYLLGTLSVEETERVDELSVADDQVASRLQAVESDLVDAYVAGRLPGGRLERFTSHYLSSPERGARVELAAALRTRATRGATVPAARAFGDRRFLPRWALAAAALVAAVGMAYFAIENNRLRDQVSQSNTTRVSEHQTVEGLRADLARERSAQESMRNEIDRLRKAEPSGRSSIQALVLMPLRRGAVDVSTVSVRRGGGHLALSLRLEENNFPRYQATLRESATRKTVWQSASIAARSANANEMLAVEVPAELLRSANYTVELSGSRENDVVVFVSSYAFRVVIE